LREQSLTTEAEMMQNVQRRLREAKQPPFEHAVIDEAQDIGVAELRLLAAIGGGRANGLFFAGDLGQRIFQTPFSWSGLGVDVRGRSRTLRINYRTSHQIRTQADRLLPSTVADADGNVEERRGTVSVFNGPEPEIHVVESVEAECALVGEWRKERAAEGVEPHEMAVFVRSRSEIERAKAPVEAAGLRTVELDDASMGVTGSVAVGTMHRAKGLEFRAVVVAACDDEVVPLQARIEEVPDEADLEDVYDTERHLLYVACTRARDRLLVTGVAPGSEFLEDLVR
jgi:superfamily I DNA/RNA helicase